MGVDPISLAIGGAILVGTAGSYQQQKKAARAQQEANQIQRQQADLQGAIQRREAVRQARMARAASMTAAENQGVTRSSSSEGALGSITTQLNSNLSFLDTYNTLSDMASERLGAAARYQSRAQDFALVANLAGQAASVDWSKLLPKPPAQGTTT